MYEWAEQFTTNGPIFTGGFQVQWNSLNPEHDYQIGGYSSDVSARQWTYIANSLELHFGFFERLNGTAENNNQITTHYVKILELSNALINHRGIYPGSQNGSGRGFVNRQSEILHKGPVEWELI